VAIRGGRCDGHDFIDAAVRAGAASVITNSTAGQATVPPGIIEIRVPDTRSALPHLAAAYYRLKPDPAAPGSGALQLVGVTGTNGKSTTCELLRSILDSTASAGRGRAALLGTIRNDLLDSSLTATMTTPPPLELCRYLAEAAQAGAGWAVMEVSSHALDQRRCDGLDFAAAVFTNLSGDHLDYHGDSRRYLAAKKRLFDRLDPAATAVVNADDPSYGSLLKDCRGAIIRYGLNGDDRLDVTAKIEEFGPCGSRYSIVAPGAEIPIRSSLVGRHNVMNALAAATTAQAFGIDAAAIRTGLEAISFVRGRLERVPVPGRQFAVFVDYAHTDDALRNVLEALRPLTAGRLVCVFGCGGDRDRAKRPRMAAAVAQTADLAIVTNDNPRTEDPDSIVAEILPGFSPTDACVVEVELDREAAINSAICQAQPDDTVLVAGKGHEDYQIVGHTRRHFDDVEAACSAIESRFGRSGEIP
jgi:UDP-N-acetylmuramoyl-L-alanyl-D-glutamate--2,6-diaminopimelate ligase